MTRRVRITVTAFSPPPTPVESADAVVAHLEAQLEAVWPDTPDIVLLPECCDQPGPVGLLAYQAFLRLHAAVLQRSIARIASAHQTHIAFTSLTPIGSNRWHNTLEIIGRDGESKGHYAKTHLTQPELDAEIVCGEGPVIIETDFGRIAPIICFDLNFMQLRGQVAKLSPDLILFPSMFHGGPLQKAWAVDCATHFAAAVRDQPSEILSPVGAALATTTTYTKHVTQEINLDSTAVHLDHHAEKLHTLKQEQGSAVRIDDPGKLGRVLVSSESDNISVDEMLQRYNIECASDYLARYNRTTER